MKSNSDSKTQSIFDIIQKEDFLNSIEQKDRFSVIKETNTFVNEDDFFRSSSANYFADSNSSLVNLEDLDQNNQLKTKPIISKNRYKRSDFDYVTALGRGAYGNVIKACHRFTGENYAIKVIDKKLIEKVSKQYQIRVENELLNLINYPGIVKIFGFFEEAGTYNLVEEYCSKGDLLNFLEKNKNLSKEEIQFILGQIILCIEYLSKLEIIHRDIKPDNFMIDGNFRLKLIDFATATFKGKIYDEENTQFIDLDKYLGISKINEEEINLAKSINNYGIRALSTLCGNSLGGKTFGNMPEIDSGINEGMFENKEIINQKIENIKKQSFVGTAEYMPPEIMNGMPIGEYTDMWSVICMAFKMFTGESPFNDKTEYLIFQNISQLKYKKDNLDKIPQDAKDLIFSMMKLDPYERFGYEKEKKMFNFDLIKNHPFFKVKEDFNLKDVIFGLMEKLKLSSKNDKEMNIIFMKNQNIHSDVTPQTHKHSADYNDPTEMRKNCHSNLKEDSKVGGPKRSERKSNSFFGSNSSLGSRDASGARKLRSGTLKKQSPYFYYDKRYLILFDTPRIDYYIPDTKELRGTINLDKSCYAKLVANNHFLLKTPERTYSFMCKDRYDISPWVNDINKAIQDYGVTKFK